EHGGEDLSRREPVLDLRSQSVPGESRVLARLPAGEEPGALGSKPRIRAAFTPKIGFATARPSSSAPCGATIATACARLPAGFRRKRSTCACSRRRRNSPKPG